MPKAGAIKGFPRMPDRTQAQGNSCYFPGPSSLKLNTAFSTKTTTPAAIEARFVAEIPTRTILTPDDVGALVAMLAVAARPTITGQSLTIDGGYSRGIFL